MPDVQSALLAAGGTTGGSPAQTKAREDAAAAVAVKIANGGTMTEQDAVAVMVGAATLVNPAVGAMLAVAAELVIAISSAVQPIFHALGWDAHGVVWNPCDNPPSGPSDPRWTSPSYPWGSAGASLLAPGTFAAFAAPALAQNAANYANCRPSVDTWQLLLQLAELWNNAHDDDETIVPLGFDEKRNKGPRQHVDASGFGSAGWVQFDPFFRGYIVTDENGSNATPYLSTWPGNPPMPDGVTTLRVNRGPLKPGAGSRFGTSTHALNAPTPILHTLNLRPSLAAGSSFVAAAPSMSTGAKVAVGVGVAGAVGAAAWGIWHFVPSARRLFL